MESIPWIESERQEHFTKFNFRTKKIHDNRISGENIVETKGPKKSFYPPELFSSWEDVNNPDRTVDDLMLDCWWDEHGNIEMPITKGLLAMLREADTDSIIWAIILKEETKEGPIHFGDIEFIGVNYLEKERTEKEAKDDELLIENPKERKQYALPEDYSTHGGDGRERKAERQREAGEISDKKAETKKPGLYIVPKRQKPPKEIMAWCKKNYKRGEWKKILRGLHKFYLYRKRREDKYYPGKSERKNRQYVYGQQWLGDKLELTRMTVERWFHRFEADGIIYIPYRGYVKRGASICELAFTDKHRKKNKRETGERKKALERKTREK